MYSLFLKKFVLIFLILAAILSACSSGSPSQPTAAPIPSPNGQADLIFYNAQILTMDTAHPLAQAIALRGNRILAVGSRDEVLLQRGPVTVLVDLQGRTMLPGFVDDHSHIIVSSSSPQDFSQIQDMAIRGGITTETEMTVTPVLMDKLFAYENAALIKLRYNTYLAYNNACGEPFDPHWYQTYKQGQDISVHIRNQGVKIFSDGGFCNVPAVSFEYLGGYGQGDLYMTADQLTAVVKEIQGAGYQVAIHALGDRAIQVAQDAIAAALDGAPNTYRHRIDHNAVLHDSLLTRYNQVGILPIIFGTYPTCWRNDPSSQFKYAVPVSLGTWEWPWRALLDSNPGIKAGWHSDYPVFKDISPIDSLYGFVTRNQVAPDGSICQAPDWLKQGAITVDEALHIMTINSAYALFRDNEIGSLETGKLADLVILSENPLQVQPEAIKDITVLETMIDGKVEYCADSAGSICHSLPVKAPPVSPIETGTPPLAVQSVTASASISDHPAADAVDGDPATWWSAGSGAVQWIQLDFGRPVSLTSLRLVVSQFPAGGTVHRIWGGESESDLHLLQEMAGDTSDMQALVFTPSTPLAGIRFLRIETTQSPSWVGWREIQAFGQ